MQIKSVMDQEFKKYGRVLKIDVPDLLERLSKTPLTSEVVYEASSPELEGCAEYELIRDQIFGGMPIQIGYCNGDNHKLDAVEFHRDSEINIPLTGAVFMLGMLQDVEDDYTYDTSKMEVFEAPAGCVLEFYGTTLHYAPCTSDGKGFRVVVVLPKGTNTDGPQVSGTFEQDPMLFARNKWLIAHPASGLDKKGAYIGLKGENLTIK